MNHKRLITLGRSVSTLFRARAKHDSIGVVAVAIRKSPGYASVAAGNDERCPGQRSTRYIKRVGAFDSQPSSVIDIGCVQSEMHVVRDNRPAIFCKRAGHRPVVTATQRIASHLFGGSGYIFNITQGINIGGGNGHSATCLAHQRSIPGRAVRVHPGINFFGQYAMCETTTDFFAGTRIIELHVHRIDYKNRVLRLPGLWFDTENKILKRAGRQRFTPRICTVSVALH